MTNIIAPVPVKVCHSSLKNNFKKVGKGFQKTFSVAGAALSVPGTALTLTQAKTDGFFRFIKFLISGAEFTLVFVPDSNPLSLMKEKFSEFKGVVEAFHLIPRSKEILVDKLYTVEKWRKSALMKCKIASRAFLTVGHTFSLVKFLRAIKLVKLDKIGLGWLGANIIGKLPLFDLIQMGSIQISAAFAIGYKGITLHSTMKKDGKSSISQAQSKLEMWKKIGKELKSTDVIVWATGQKVRKDLLIQKYETKLKNDKANKETRAKWQLNLDAIKRGDGDKLAKYKVERWDLKKQHRVFEKKNAAVGIAAEVAKISIITLSMTLAALSIGTGFVPMLALASVGTLSNGLGWISFLYTEMGKPKPLAESFAGAQKALAAPAA